jgi:hypothetical protein
MLMLFYRTLVVSFAQEVFCGQPTSTKALLGSANPLVERLII